MSRRASVLVTGVGGRSVGHQVLHALLLLEEQYRVVAADADPFSFHLYQVSTKYLVPPASDPEYIGAILPLVERERMDAILYPAPGVVSEVATFHNWSK